MYSKLNVAVEGSIGAGKTTVLKNILTKLQALLPLISIMMIPEPVAEWQSYHGVNMLDNSYKDPQQWGFRFQVLALMGMVNNYMKKNLGAINIYERMATTSTAVFATKFLEDGIISLVEWNILKDLEKNLLSNPSCEKVDLILYLQAKPETVQKRIASRNRSEETSIDLSTLKQLDRIYTAHIKSVSCKNIVIVDADQSENEVLEQCIKSILKHFDYLKPSSLYTPEK